MNKKFFIGLVVAVYFVPFLVSKNTLIETTHAAETPEAVMPPGWALYSEVLTAALNGPRYPVIMSPEIKKAFSVYEEQLVAVVEEVEEAKVRQEASVPDIEGNTVTETKREPLSNRKVKYSKPRTFASGSSSTPTPAEPTPAESGTEVPAEPTPAESAEPAEPAEPEVPVVEKEPVDPVVPPRVTVEEAKERAGEFTNEIEGEKFIYNSGSETPQGNRQERKQIQSIKLDQYQFQNKLQFSQKIKNQK